MLDNMSSWNLNICFKHINQTSSENILIYGCKKNCFIDTVVSGQDEFITSVSPNSSHYVYLIWILWLLPQEI